MRLGQLSPQGNGGRGTERVTEHEGVHRGDGLVGLSAGESCRLIDRQVGVVVAGFAVPVGQVRPERMQHPRVACQHGMKLGGHGPRGLSPAHGQGVRQRDLVPRRVDSEVHQVVLASHVPVDGGRGRLQAFPQGAHIQSVQAVLVEEPDRARHDLVPGQGVTSHGSILLELSESPVIPSLVLSSRRESDMRKSPMAGFVEQRAAQYEIPGVAVAIRTKGKEYLTCHGVTDLDRPEPIEPDTPFLVASVTKTFTATAMMCLVASQQVDLDAPVRRYLPDFAVADVSASAEITVLNLLNHTAGLDWRSPDQPDDSDGALARYVAALRDQQLIAAPGERVSYSQSGYNIAGRIIEVVTGMTYEEAIAALLLESLALRHSTFAPLPAVTEPVARGHNVWPGGALAAVEQWKPPRANNPGGGLAASISALLAWARFHLSDGGSVLPAKYLHVMRKPTATLSGSSLGDAVGIGWFLRTIDGVHAFGHAGSADGQFPGNPPLSEKGLLGRPSG